MTCSPVAYDMRNQLLHAFRFAFRKDPVLLSRVAVIAHWTGHANMIRYLNDLAVLEQANTKSLSAIWFDLSLLDTAVTTATEMAELSATANGDKAGQNASKTIRDKVCAHLKKVINKALDY